MSYEKQTWVTGDIVTAEKLNHIENGIVDAPGYSTSSELLTEETFTSIDDGGYYYAMLTYGTFINAPALNVVYDDVEYICPLQQSTYGDESTYGDDSFSEYPFAIYSSQSYGNSIDTETIGEHTIRITAIEVTTTSSFEMAVSNSLNKPILITVERNASFALIDKSYATIKEAIYKGITITAYWHGTPEMTRNIYTQAKYVVIDFSFMEYDSDNNTSYYHLRQFLLDDEDNKSYVEKDILLN